MTVEVITALGAIPTGIAGMYLLYRIVGNHLNHNTEVLDKLSASIDKSNELNNVFFAWLKGRLDTGRAREDN